MNPLTRRRFLGAAASLAPLVALPELASALASTGVAPDWRLAFQDVEDDVRRTPMALIHGRAPPELRGTLYRNGPGKFHRRGGSATHWFDGDGLVRAFDVDGGRASLAARFVDTPKRRADAAAEAVVSGGFGTRPASGIEIGSGDSVNAANTSVVMRGDELWALWEAGSPTALDPGTLATRGARTLRADLEHMPFLAHPRIEPGGRLWNLGLAGNRAVIWQVALSGTLIAAVPIELPRASYVHDFTATDRDLILVLQPWVQSGDTTNPVIAGLNWRPELGTQVLVLDKTDLSSRRLFELPPFFFFHLGDAWRTSGGAIQFDVCRYERPEFATTVGRELLDGVDSHPPQATLALVTLDRHGGARIEDTGIGAEFPRSDPRRSGSIRTQTVHVAHPSAERPLFQGIGVHDWSRDRSRTYDFGKDHIVEEMVFLAARADAAEMSGWILGPTLNLRERATELHLFDAARVDLGPICTWRGSCALPVGFHGIFAAGA